MDCERSSSVACWMQSYVHAQKLQCAVPSIDRWCAVCQSVTQLITPLLRNLWLMRCLTLSVKSQHPSITCKHSQRKLGDIHRTILQKNCVCVQGRWHGTRGRPPGGCASGAVHGSGCGRTTAPFAIAVWMPTTITAHGSAHVLAPATGPCEMPVSYGPQPTDGARLSRDGFAHPG